MYEYYKVFIYFRIDFRYLILDIVGILKDRIKVVNISDYLKICNRLLKSNIIVNKLFVDNLKVIDYYVIILIE